MRSRARWRSLMDEDAALAPLTEADAVGQGSLAVVLPDKLALGRSRALLKRRPQPVRPPRRERRGDEAEGPHQAPLRRVGPPKGPRGGGGLRGPAGTGASRRPGVGPVGGGGSRCRLIQFVHKSNTLSGLAL